MVPGVMARRSDSRGQLHFTGGPAVALFPVGRAGARGRSVGTDLCAGGRCARLWPVSASASDAEAADLHDAILNKPNPKTSVKEFLR